MRTPRLPARAIMSTVNDTAHVQVSGDRTHIEVSGAVSGRYVIHERRVGGELLIAPDTSAAAMGERLGLREATADEFAQFVREHGSQLLPPDGER